jgi:SAM-dependent methyltransferase
MHDTAYDIGRLFFDSYVRSGDMILDIGSQDVNGSLRDFRPPGSRYVGVDLAPGKGVDVVVDRISRLPFAGHSFDVVISTSCLEHDAMFWVTFLEMCRIVRRGGYIYLNAPSRGTYHRFPIDAWRFFPDSGVALRDWARISGHRIELLESFVTENKADVWNDCAMVFTREGTAPGILIADRHDRAINVRCWPNVAEIRRRRDAW